MKVVILCGGKGYRIREETEFKPKPMVEVGGRPILWHIMNIYSHYGHKEFILPLGYKGDIIKEFFVEEKWRTHDFTLDSLKNVITLHKNNEEKDWIIHFIDTGVETGTALRLNKVKKLLEGEEDFLFTYGDGLSDVDINKLIDFHKMTKKVATLTGVQAPSRFGIIKEKEGIVDFFQEKPKIEDFINGGFMVLNKKIFDYLSEDNVMFEVAVLPRLAKEKELAIYKHMGFWYSMDTYRDYLELNKMWEENYPWAVWKKKGDLSLGNGSSWEIKK